MDYSEFLASKVVRQKDCGFAVSPGALNPMLFPFQRDLSAWALRRGRAALFEDCGLGKTPQQLEWASRVHAHTSGDVLIPVSLWQRYASPVWMDINPSKTLQYTTARDGKDERHICPLQLEVIERAVQLWTNPGDVVLSPFAGIGSEGYVSLKMGRRFVGVELKESYYAQAVKNLREAEASAQSGTLFETAPLLNTEAA